MGDRISLCTWWSDRICDQRANELFGKENFWKGKKRKEDRRKTGKTDKPVPYDRICGWRDCTGDVWCDSAAYADNGNPDDEYH